MINPYFTYYFSSYTKNNGNNHTSSTSGSFGPLSRQKKNSKSSGNNISKTHDQQKYSKTSQPMDTIFFGQMNGVSLKNINNKITLFLILSMYLFFFHYNKKFEFFTEK